MQAGVVYHRRLFCWASAGARGLQPDRQIPRSISQGGITTLALRSDKEQAAVYYSLQCNCCHLYHLAAIILWYLFRELAEMQVFCTESILPSQGQAVLKHLACRTWTCGSPPAPSQQCSRLTWYKPRATQLAPQRV